MGSCLSCGQNRLKAILDWLTAEVFQKDVVSWGSFPVIHFIVVSSGISRRPSSKAAQKLLILDRLKRDNAIADTIINYLYATTTVTLLY